MDRNARIYVAGHRGLVGSAIVRKLTAEGYGNLLLRTSGELDLRDQAAVAAFFAAEQPDYVFLAAAKVGGIVANNTYPAEFIYDNLMIEANVIHSSYRTGVSKLLFLGSTCIYPKMASQPIREEYLLTGPLEPTNEAYAIAKIAGISLCRSYNRQYGTRFIAAMPTNLYGPNDNFDLEKSHVLPALIRKFHEAKIAGAPTVTVWGTGAPLREFIHVDDVADAALYLMRHHEGNDIVNIGSGEEISIRDLALLVKIVVGFEGELVFDASKPDGTPRKLSDVSRLHSLGWRHRIGLEDGVRETYEWFVGQGFPAETM
ncbi:GDP-L-fucose synthase [Geobacter sulfurreducens]|jgi:GDP-L-fucose synthase|uniref:GDP-L-fucose synthase n=1 Tax=Geobacter sulfurreducens (strain ATCC 51573 / DSM 12127 / PCA) TaxID=243231 RepID=Q74FI1_GEOSL|nr:GDP-L-fucose synthase [Geobacter sulfurreducens]AAR33958.1 GDP-L-fucose synthase [Geobacter sulfurreducens PCA]ADI83468.1 GDP-L-fucose synthase [Geobacter sulfurreducens KN400]AJY70380.1 GDP-L-fucose synthase [Geobacter sulfurreducens]QVW35870.1 GDP-L-fucose synthase [Geobacter sulfurreducens]UAC04694.1 GDP-L-fucose synthase [Geobacter sulfurreducens]